MPSLPVAAINTPLNQYQTTLLAVRQGRYNCYEGHQFLTELTAEEIRGKLPRISIYGIELKLPTKQLRMDNSLSNNR